MIVNIQIKEWSDVDLTFNMDRECTYKDITYKVLDEMSSGFLLVVEKEKLDEGVFPLETFVIPENLVK